MSVFYFKQFSIEQERCAMKISTDACLLGAWTQCDDAETILDIGTGTGLLALMLAQKNKKATISAVECDEAACSQASDNFRKSPWSERLNAVYCKIQDFKPEYLFDLIICNPPYYPEQNFLKSPNPQKRVARSDALLPFKDLVDAVSVFLKPEGQFNLILPIEVAGVFVEIANSRGLYLNSSASVFTQIGKKSKRTLMQFSKINSELISEDIFIREKIAEQPLYTERYRKLLKDYLTIF
jgi:tRNA1Val (adenine37-N6)-methyltransferase